MYRLHVNVLPEKEGARQRSLLLTKEIRRMAVVVSCGDMIKFQGRGNIFSGTIGVRRAESTINHTAWLTTASTRGGACALGSLDVSTIRVPLVTGKRAPRNAARRTTAPPPTVDRAGQPAAAAVPPAASHTER